MTSPPKEPTESSEFNDPIEATEPSTTLTLTVGAEAVGTRLDLFITKTVKGNTDYEKKIRGLTRSAIQGLIKDGLILLNGKSSTANRKVKGGDVVLINVPRKKASTIQAEDIPLDILFEDDDIIIINKAQGLTVHPGAGRTGGTLVNALLSHTDELSDVGGPVRAGIVHRLDKDTSGVIVVAKNNPAHLKLSEQFKEHSTERVYHALSWGDVKDDEGVIELPIGRDSKDRKKISPRTRMARKAVTRYKVLRRYPTMTLLEMRPETGRTHQIRVHLTAIGHPIIGDPTYGSRPIPPILAKNIIDAIKRLKGQFLHARSLALTHPSNGERMEFVGEYPDDMAELLKLLEKRSATE